MGQSNGRDRALSALLAFDRGRDKADEALDAALSPLKDPREKALATRIFYGVIQNLSLLDFYISAFSSLKKNKISPSVLWILRIGMYQLVFLDRVPKSAAVDTSVTLAKRYANPRAASFVNAVLRKASGGGLPQVPETDKASFLSLKYSHPLWLVSRFLSLFGARNTERLLADNNGVCPTALRVNTLKGTVENAEAALLAAGIRVGRHPFAEHCLVAENSGFFEETGPVQNGLVYVQDPSSQLCVEALSPEPGSKVVDLCAAPGGKSVLCAQIMENKGQVLSLDINENKIKMIEQNAKRLGASVIKTEVSDALSLREDLLSSADFVVCDVPCSGFGVIRKKPDIRFKTREDVASLPEMQRRILENASRYVKKGGFLLYSTCTIFAGGKRGSCKRLSCRPSGIFAGALFRRQNPLGNRDAASSALYF